MKRHPIDVFSLVAGLMLTATAVVLMDPSPEVRRLWDALPLAFVVAGIALVVSARSQRTPVSDEPDHGARDDTAVLSGEGRASATETREQWATEDDLLAATDPLDPAATWPGTQWRDEPDDPEASR